MEGNVGICNEEISLVLKIIILVFNLLYFPQVDYFYE